MDSSPPAPEDNPARARPAEVREEGTPEAQLPLPTRFSWEHAIVLAVAAVIGVYAGMAAGLFAHSIRFVQLVLFRSGELWRSLVLDPEGMWRAQFERRLLAAHWHAEFLATALLLLAGALTVENLTEKRRLRIPLSQAHRLRAIGMAGAFGLALYYPLVVLATFNGTFHESESGLYGMLLEAPRWRWVVGPALGALFAGLLVRRVNPESGGHGVVEVIEAVHKGRWEQMRGRVAIWKSLAAGLVIGSGGSAGREGPVVHLGGAVAASLGRTLALQEEQIKLLLACGGGAGIAASFHAPLAGSMFALEIILGDFSVASFTPIVLASVTATVTASSVVGTGGDLRSVQWTLAHPAEIAVHLALGVAAGICGIVYIRSVRGAEELFAGHRGGALGRLLSQLRPEWRAALGGLCVGVLALAAPRTLGTGIESMNAALAGQLALGALGLTLALKLLATACTLGSGAPGGSFFPAAFLGTMLGGAFGRIAHWLLPSVAPAGEAYAVIGMGAVVAGATAAPLTGVLMMFELTGSYQIVLPLLVACGVAAALVQGHVGGSLYTLAAQARGVFLGWRGTSLRDLSVAQAIEKVEFIPEDISSSELARIVADTTHRAVLVVSRSGRVIGLIPVLQIRGALLDASLAQITVARDLCRTDIPVLLPDDDLESALNRLTEAGTAEAIVSSNEGDTPVVLGILTREGALDAWRRATEVQ